MQILRLKIRCAAVSFKSETQSYNWTLNGLLGVNRPEKMQSLYADRAFRQDHGPNLLGNMRTR